jgi:hypothetical protein
VAAYSLFVGDPRGRRCSGCDKPLFHTEIIYEWRSRLYHLGCLLDVLTAIAPPDPVCYQPPGADWQAP